MCSTIDTSAHSITLAVLGALHVNGEQAWSCAPTAQG
jgi:hypothetical protein